MSERERLSFKTDILPLFTETDIQHMKAYGMDLSSRDEVARHAESILEVVTAGTMPPPVNGSRWTNQMCATFQRWKDEGCAP